MNVLFVSSGNNKHGISSIIYNQGESLKKAGVQIDYFTITGKGITGYLYNLPALRAKLRQKEYHLIHAHYSLSAMLVSLTFPKQPIIVSLMGSDTSASSFWRFLIKLNYAFLWHTVIVKSAKMKSALKLKKAQVIPNGVDVSSFPEQEKEAALKMINWRLDKKYVLFLADPSRYEKNYPLANEAFYLLKDQTAELKVVYNIAYPDVVHYLNAADVLLLTSLWEGSPNVIKEAMACNCPIVATDVGDISWLLSNLKGCYVTGFDKKEIASRLQDALLFAARHGRTQGKKRLIELGLSAEAVALNIKEVYKNSLNRI